MKWFLLVVLVAPLRDRQEPWSVSSSRAPEYRRGCEPVMAAVRTRLRREAPACQRQRAHGTGLNFREHQALIRRARRSNVLVLRVVSACRHLASTFSTRDQTLNARTIAAKTRAAPVTPLLERADTASLAMFHAPGSCIAQRGATSNAQRQTTRNKASSAENTIEGGGRTA